MVYPIDATTTALLLIDPQREYFDDDRPLYTPNAEKIRGNLVKLRDAARQIGLQVVFVKHVHKADGSDLGRMGDFDPTPVFIEGTASVEFIPDLLPTDGEIVVEKTRYSAFVNTPLRDILKEKKIDTVLITGLMTNYCSVTTARHAHDLDYKTIFIVDANAGPDMPDMGFGAVSHDDIMKVTATSLSAGIADVTTTAFVLSHLREMLR
ncbi:MAG TPA: isochorismatase family cysteine hydrolase [Candidatus Baltobacteraceae bacterium]|jgi:ureidoacrylate peracid hydrolase|nr:isochorismatase family cysteine hydrolase [Candidatus Baltobacteraceae bacterium]